MLYTQDLIIPDSGVIRIGTIGGSPDIQANDGNRYQIGYQIPVRYGVISWNRIGADSNDIYNVIAEVKGYGNHLVSNLKSPGRCIVELPASIEFTGPVGTRIQVEAWLLDSFNTRGANRTFAGAGVNYAVEDWAETFDFSGTSATFRNAAGAVVGTVAGTVSGFSVPAGAVTVDLVGATATIVFRQN